MNRDCTQAEVATHTHRLVMSMSAELAVAAMGRGVSNVVLPRDIVDIIRRLTFERRPLLDRK